MVGVKAARLVFDLADVKAGSKAWKMDDLWVGSEVQLTADQSVY